MKNKLSVLVVFLILLMVGAGCNLSRFTGSGDESGKSGSKTEEGKSDSDKKSSSSSSEDVLNSGIPECDELAKYVNDNSEEIEGTFVGKAIILMYKNTILKSLEESADKMNDEEKQKMGEVCAKTMKQLKENAEDK